MKNTKKELSFEEAMSRLEEIVGLLENGGATLDETMTLYAEGAKLSKICSEKLEKAEQSVKQVKGEKSQKAGKNSEQDD